MTKSSDWYQMTREQQEHAILDKISGAHIQPIRKERNEKADKIVSDLIDFMGNMNDWEYNFIETITDWLEEKKPISDKQYEVILKLESKYL